MPYVVDTTTALINLLRSYLPRPGTKEWIYSDYPRLDATFPRISVTQTSGSVTDVGIGELGEKPKESMVTLTYDIDVWVKASDRVVIGNETYVGTKLRDKYADMIIEILDNRKEELRATANIIDVEVTNIVTVALDEEHMLHRKTITVRVTRCV